MERGRECPPDITCVYVLYNNVCVCVSYIVSGCQLLYTYDVHVFILCIMPLPAVGREESCHDLS